MTVLGIDYGRARVGLAIADGLLASPLTTVEWAMDKDKLERSLRGIVEREKVTKIVVGISEGVMAKESEELAQMLSVKMGMPVLRVDETLTTVEAKRRLLEGKVGKKRRTKMVDAAAAAVILQYWLDQGGMVQ